MYRTVEDFLNAWHFEADITRRVFAVLTDESLSFGNEYFPRGIGRVSQHIVEAIPAFFGTIGSSLGKFESGKTRQALQTCTASTTRW